MVLQEERDFKPGKCNWKRIGMSIARKRRSRTPLEVYIYMSSVLWRRDTIFGSPGSTTECSVISDLTEE